MSHPAGPAADFGPLTLRAVREDMIQSGLCRTTINARINRIWRVFRWAASLELLLASVPQALATVPGVLCARRFRATSANRRYVALYHLVSPDVQATPAWKSAADSEWTRRLRPHFRDHLRLVCRKYLRGGCG